MDNTSQSNSESSAETPDPKMIAALLEHDQKAAIQALVRFDRMLKNSEKGGVEVVKIEDIRRAFNGCIDKFEVQAAELSTWDMDLI